MSRPVRATATTPAVKAPRSSPAKGQGASMTHERIAADLDAFRKSGGRIEVLGVTRTLQRIDPALETAPAKPAPAPVSRTRR